MTVAVVARDSNNVLSMGDLGWRAALPILLIFLAQVGLYLWMAPRGFDFTDESYYFLNYLYWREFVGTVTFFGAYFELPFRLFGQSVPAIRVFSLVVLLTSSALFARELFCYYNRRDGVICKTSWAFIVVCMAGAFFFFGPPLNTLRAPSYNLLTLSSMLVGTGLLLRLLERTEAPTNARLTAFCYGVAIGACGLGKASSGALLVLVHALFFLLANRDWRLRNLLQLLVLALAGMSLNFAVLQWAHPQWLMVLFEGVAMTASTDGRSALDLANIIRWDIQTQLRELLPWAVGVGIAFVFLLRWIGPSRRTMLSVLVFTLVSGCVLGLMLGPARWWLSLMVLTTLLLWIIAVVNRNLVCLTRDDVQDLGLAGLLFALPIAFSFGTNMLVLEHSRMAAVFAVMAVAIWLYRLTRLGLLTAPAVIASFTVLCIPTLVGQLKAATDVRFTYRQLEALGGQSKPVRLGAADNTLLVDATTRETLQSIIGAAHSAGFALGQSIADFTGDGPGLIYALGGAPLGTAWLLGGYPGSAATAKRLITQLPPVALQNAWLLSSDDNPRAIIDWKTLVTERLGYFNHEHVATVYVRAPYSWVKNSPERITVLLWKPPPQ